MPTRAALLLSLALTWSCAPRAEPATAIVVSVKTDLELGSELRELSYRVFAAQADPERDLPVAELVAAAQTLEHPFVILKQRADELLLSVEGFARSAEDPVVVARVRARFEQGKTLALHVFLARACLLEFCDADGLTCFGQSYGQVEAGQCAGIPGPMPLSVVARPGDESDWLAASFTTSADCSR